MSGIRIPPPELQIDFARRIADLRGVYLREALNKTVERIDPAALEKELADYVPAECLTDLTQQGLRGELLYPVPCLLEQNPYLLGYYRLLLGFSQKEFYSSTFGIASFKAMESDGVLRGNTKARLPELCSALIKSAAALAESAEQLSRELVDDLTLLTLGPQLRGGANVKRGEAGIVDVFEAIFAIVKNSGAVSAHNRIELKNAAGRKVCIEFAADPDIVIREEMSGSGFRNIIAIEVKGGRDFSNIHNRVGEAEKSHQKARAAGYVECWTVVNVDRIDIDTAKQESPSTNTFYRLSSLKARAGEEYEDFKARIISLTGIRI